MNVRKHLICHHFSKAAHTYDDVAWVQKEAAEQLFLLIKSNMYKDPATILDVGAGTGYLTSYLSNFYTNSLCELNDLSLPMLEAARKKLGTTSQFIYSLGDIETHPLRMYDLIASNLALQWVDDLPQIINKLHRYSKTLAFSGLLENSFAEWRDLFQDRSLPSPIPKYPSKTMVEGYLSSLNYSQFQLKTATYSLSFDGAKGFMRYLQQLGGSYTPAKFAMKDLKKLIQDLTHRLHITYHLFFAIVKKST
jgi:malonyl-ACP O-methyltransferase BioC